MCSGAWKFIFPLKNHTVRSGTNTCILETRRLFLLCEWSHWASSAFLEPGFRNSSKAKSLLFGSSQRSCCDILPVTSTFLILVSWGLGFHAEIPSPYNPLADCLYRKWWHTKLRRVFIFWSMLNQRRLDHSFVVSCCNDRTQTWGS